MNAINLTTKIINDPDLTGFMFYVESGELFDADNYAETYNLNRSDLDAQDVHSVQNVASQLNDGQWLLVEHHIE